MGLIDGMFGRFKHFKKCKQTLFRTVNMVSFLNKTGNNILPLVRKQDLANRYKVFELIKQTLGLFYKNICSRSSQMEAKPFSESDAESDAQLSF